MIRKCRQAGSNDDSVAFIRQVLNQSGIGDRNAISPAFPVDQSIKAARFESELVISDIVSRLLLKHGICGKDVDVLIVNCSLFSPTPSLCSWISHKFDMRSDLITYNLSGMGCSASLIALSLADQTLKISPNQLALVVSTENLAQNYYSGTEKDMLIQNVLFRVGGAAILLSGKKRNRKIKCNPMFTIEAITRVCKV